MAWERPANDPDLGEAPGPGIQDRQRRTAHQLLDVSPVELARCQLVNRMEACCQSDPVSPAPRAPVLAQPRRAGRHAAIPRVPAPRVSGAGLGVERPERPPPVPEADERLARARRRRRLHQAAAGRDRSLRQAARRHRPRPSAVLRQRDPVLRSRAARPGREPHGASDQDRGQPRSSRQPRRYRRVHAGGHSRALRSRSRQDRHRIAAKCRPGANFLSAMLAAIAAQKSRQGAGSAS